MWQHVNRCTWEGDPLAGRQPLAGDRASLMRYADGQEGPAILPTDQSASVRENID